MALDWKYIVYKNEYDIFRKYKLLSILRASLEHSHCQNF